MTFLAALLGFIPGITTILGFLGPLVPSVVNLISSIETAKYNAQVQIVAAKIGGSVEAAKAIVAAQVATEQARVQGLAVIAGNKLLTILVVAFATPIAILAWKVIVWDVVIGAFVGCGGSHPGHQCSMFNTDPIHGQIADIMNTVIWSLFGSTAAVSGIKVAAGLVRNASK
jgi:hypothetical protein